MRKSGFYWVIEDNETGWEVARYDDERKCWNLNGSDCDYNDNEFRKIDEKKLENKTMFSEAYDRLKAIQNSQFKRNSLEPIKNYFDSTH